MEQLAKTLKNIIHALLNAVCNKKPIFAPKLIFKFTKNKILIRTINSFLFFAFLFQYIRSFCNDIKNF